MMKRILVLAATVALALGPDLGLAQEVHRLSGGNVAVYNLAGAMRVVQGQGSDVVVRLTRGGQDAELLQVRLGEVRGRRALTVLYPDDEVVYPELGRGSRSTLRVDDEGVFGTGRGRRVTVRGFGDGLEAWADMVVEVPRGTELAVHLAVGETEVEGVDGRLIVDTGSGSVRARDVAGSLNVDTGSGQVDVLRAQGPVRVDTGSGSVRLREIRGDRVLVDTGSGGVVGSAIEADELEVDTGSGSIELQEVTATDVLLDTGSGSVEIALTRDIRRLIVDTGSGSVTVRAPESLGAEVEIETGSGGIDVEFPLRMRTARRDLVIGTIGDGQGQITIDTGSGGVRLLQGS